MSMDDSLPFDEASLPDDPELLKRLIQQLLIELRSERSRGEQLEHRLDLLLRRLYGRSSEKIDPHQMALFDNTVEENTDALTTASTPETTSSSTKKQSGHGRRPLSEKLVREEVVHDVSEAEFAALGGRDRFVSIGEDITEQLEWEPARVYVIRHIRKKYARREQLPESGPEPAQKNIIAGSKPPQPIPGGLAGPGLLASVITSKYADHLPLHRQESILRRSGIELTRNTLCDWVMSCADLFRSIYEVLKQVVLASHVLHTDDTSVKVRDAQRKQQYLGRFWTYVGDEQHPLIFFDFTKSRQRAGPDKILSDYEGYLQADAFTGYDGIYLGSRGTIIEVACWAHARRKVYEARRIDSARAQVALAYIHQLYEIERRLRERMEGEWRELTSEDRAEQVRLARQEQALSQLQKLEQWIEQEAPSLLPKNPLRQALDYIRSNWQALVRYTESGRLDIDNNEAERVLRGIALGRKNWLFCGSDRGGHAAAIHFSLIASCKRHGLDPFAYLRDILRRLPLLNSPTTEQLRALLPDVWKAE